MGETTHFASLADYKHYLAHIENNDDQVRRAFGVQNELDDVQLLFDDDTLSNKQFVEVIALCRRANYNKSSGGANKVAENETDRDYAKNPWKFVEEFLQNADDCEYDGDPTIDIRIDVFF